MPYAPSQTSKRSTSNFSPADMVHSSIMSPRTRPNPVDRALADYVEAITDVWPDWVEDSNLAAMSKAEQKHEVFDALCLATLEVIRKTKASSSLTTFYYSLLTEFLQEHISEDLTVYIDPDYVGYSFDQPRSSTKYTILRVNVGAESYNHPSIKDLKKSWGFSSTSRAKEFARETKLKWALERTVTWPEEVDGLCPVCNERFDPEVDMFCPTCVEARASHEEADYVENPDWVMDHEIWERAKYSVGEEDDDSYWPTVVSVYQSMGGRIARNA